MTIPDYLPQLRTGTGATPKDGGCLVQVAGFLYDGESWTDRAACVHPALRSAGILVNDSLSKDGLRRLSLLAARISGSGTFVEDWSVEGKVRLHADLARWSAKSAAKSAAYAAESAAEYAAYAAKYAAEYAAYAAESAEYAAESAAYAAESAAYAAESAAYAAESAARDDALITFYTGLVDEFDRLTGRNSQPLTEEQGNAIRELIGAH